MLYTRNSLHEKPSSMHIFHVCLQDPEPNQGFWQGSCWKTSGVSPKFPIGQMCCTWSSPAGEEIFLSIAYEPPQLICSL